MACDTLGTEAGNSASCLLLVTMNFKSISSSGETYHVKMQFRETVLYVNDVSAVVDFYRRAFDLEVRFWDEALESSKRSIRDARIIRRCRYVAAI
jgi:hypothetical protein